MEGQPVWSWVKTKLLPWDLNQKHTWGRVDHTLIKGAVSRLEKLLVNDKIRASCQTNMSPRHYVKLYKQQKWTLENIYADKFSKSTLQSASIFFKVFPSVLPFVFAVLFLPSFHVLSSYIHVSFSLLAVPTVVCYTAVFSVVTQRSEDRFRDKAPLTLYPVQGYPLPRWVRQ